MQQLRISQQPKTSVEWLGWMMETIEGFRKVKTVRRSKELRLLESNRIRRTKTTAEGKRPRRSLQPPLLETVNRLLKVETLLPQDLQRDYISCLVLGCSHTRPRATGFLLEYREP